MLPAHQTLSSQKSSTTSFCAISEVILLQKPQLYLFWRKDLLSHYLLLDDLAATLFHFIYEKKNFAEVCEALCEYLPEAEVPQYAVQQIVAWINEGLLAADFCATT